MSTISTFFRRLRKDQSGVTAIEYGLIAGAISVAIIAGAFAIGGQIGPTFTCIGNSLLNQANACAAAPAAN